MKETGFDNILKRFISEGKLYVGVSAGSILAGPDITVSRDINDVGLTDFSGLGITQTVVVVHYDKQTDDRLDKISKKFHAVPLTDEQALLITNDEEKILN